jgi:hypothetical protein
MRNSYEAVVREPEGKKLFGRPWCIWEDKVKMSFKEVRCKLLLAFQEELYSMELVSHVSIQISHMKLFSHQT